LDRTGSAGKPRHAGHQDYECSGPRTDPDKIRSPVRHNSSTHQSHKNGAKRKESCRYERNYKFSVSTHGRFFLRAIRYAPATNNASTLWIASAKRFLPKGIES